MTSSESTALKLADPTAIRESDLKIKVYGWAKDAADPMCAGWYGEGPARISKVIFAEDFHMLAGEWFQKGRTIEKVIGL